MSNFDDLLIDRSPLNLEGGMPSRDEVLSWFMIREGQLPGSRCALEDVLIRLHEIVLESKSPSGAEYIVTQVIGSPSRTVKQEISDTAIFKAYGETMAELGFSSEQAEAVTSKVAERLKGE